MYSEYLTYLENYVSLYRDYFSIIELLNDDNISSDTIELALDVKSKLVKLIVKGRSKFPSLVDFIHNVVVEREDCIDGI